MKFKQNYWLFQSIGWTVYTMSEFIGYFLLFDFDSTEIENLLYNICINILVGMLLTHYFRGIYKKYNWVKLSIPALAVRAFVSFIIISFLMSAINIYLDEQLIDTSKSNIYLTVLSYFINNGKPVLFWMLIYLFYSYQQERRIDAVEKVQMQASIEASEAKILRAQINPHFMFNALNSIRALIIEDPSKAQSSITQLSNILRSSLVADRKTTISLGEELKTVEDYLSLEKVRYEERLQINWEIETQSRSVQVPPMMLQTLVENAIKHGVQKATRWGFVMISAWIQDNHLNIKIKNTGVLKSTENNNIDGGFGLKNTLKRLRILYGSRAEFRIIQEDEKTVCATLCLPIDKNIN